MRPHPLATSSIPRLRRSLGTGLLVTVIAVLGACGGSGGGTSAPITPTTPTTPTTPNTPGPVVATAVRLSGSAFVPPDIQVTPGATVTFTNTDGIVHDVTFASTAITSVGNFTTGDRTAVMPTTAGTYAYRCTHHIGMNGSVLVK